MERTKRNEMAAKRLDAPSKNRLMLLTGELLSAAIRSIESGSTKSPLFTIKRREEEDEPHHAGVLAHSGRISAREIDAFKDNHLIICGVSLENDALNINFELDSVEMCDIYYATCEPMGKFRR